MMDFELNHTIRESLSRRRAICLDTNVWIDLAEEKDGIAREIRTLLLELTATERVFCPLSAPVIWELRKQKGHSLQLVAAFMEQVSENVTFRSFSELCHREVDAFISFIVTGESKRLAIEHLYGPVLSYIMSGFELKFPQVWASSDRALLTQHIDGIANRMSLGEFVRLSGTGPTLAGNRQPAYAAVVKERFDFCKGDIDKMRHVEQEHVARSIVVPLIKQKRARLPIEAQLLFTQRVAALPKSKKYHSLIEYILTHLPAIQAYVEVMTISGRDPRRGDSMRDFYDKEMMINPLAYGDVFVSQDRWIKSMMAAFPTHLTNKKLRFVGDLHAFRIELRSIQQEI